RRCSKSREPKSKIENRRSKMRTPSWSSLTQRSTPASSASSPPASSISTTVLAQSEIEFHGSARSIAGFELHLAIEHTRDLLTSGGGHAMAGGVKLPHANLDPFRDRLNASASEKLTDDLLPPAMILDGTLTLDD